MCVVLLVTSWRGRYVLQTMTRAEVVRPELCEHTNQDETDVKRTTHQSNARNISR